ncbi:uncharacterized protein [Anabrus simplex]|uniref:uncharacterized protein isoform X2 n=1 Tax=Anabrus simplex TaxID=316456 RepID=UPI0034DD6119
MTGRRRRSRLARSSAKFGKSTPAKLLELHNLSSRKSRRATKGDSATPTLPKAPEMPLKPYMKYSRDVWHQVKAANPRLMMWELGRIIGEMWRALPEAVRNQYFEDYEGRKMLYKEAMKRYHSSPAYLAWQAAKAKEAELLEQQAKSQQNKKTCHNNEERVEEQKIFLQELSPLQDDEENTAPQEQERLMNTNEVESKVFVQEFIPLNIKQEENVASDEETPYVHIKQEVPDICEDTDSADATPSVSLDRLKSLLASQLKTSVSRGSHSTTSAAPSAAQESSGSLLRCDHCISYFTSEELAAHLHKEICQNFYCGQCSRKFGTRAQFMLHLCISGEMFQQYDSAEMNSEEPVSLCTICGKQFLNNRKLVSHLMTHKVNCDTDVQSGKFRSREEAMTNFSIHNPECSELCLKRRHPYDP